MAFCVQEEGLSLELSSKDTYEEVSRQLAAALSPPLEEPLKLRFTQQNNYTQQPKPQPMRFPTQEQDLPDMLHHFGQVSDTLFYEVLDLPLPELERLKTLKVTLPCKRCPCFLFLRGSCSSTAVVSTAATSLHGVPSLSGMWSLPASAACVGALLWYRCTAACMLQLRLYCSQASC